MRATRSALSLLLAVVSGANGATVLTSSLNPSTCGQSVTLTATVTGVPSGSGRVTFYDGATVLGTTALVNGRATLTASFPGSGVRSITARYAGEKQKPDTSPALTQTVTSFVRPGAVTAPPTVVIDAPAPGAVMSGIVNVTGWALDNSTAIGTAISNVVVTVDGAVVGNATYGLSRPDVCAVYPGRSGCPNVGYNFPLNTNGLSVGTHTITVSATDTDSPPDVGSATVSVSTSNIPPLVTIDSPLAGSVLSGTVAITGWALDNGVIIGTTISSVQVAVDGTVVANATYGVSRADVCSVYPARPGCPNVGFNFALNTSVLTAGSHVITVSATDSDGTRDVGSKSVTVTVASAPPSVYIESLAPGAVVSGTATVSGWAIDSATSVGTSIASVVVKVDGTVVGNASYGASRPDVCAAYPGRPNCPNVGFTYALDTTKLASGQHLLSVVATDTDGNPDSGSWTVTFQVSGPPSVHIDAPAPGATVSGAVTVSGWALDNVAPNATPIGSVQIQVDGAVVGTANYGTSRGDVCTAFPGRPGCPNVGFTYQLNTNSLTPGTHTITAVAMDTDGSPDIGSSSVTVTVTSGPPPSVHIDSPSPGALVTGTVSVTGWAIDSTTATGTAIGKVQIQVDGMLVGTATYGVLRPDVCAAFPGRPGCPNVGFTFQLNTASLSSGTHTITAVATDTDNTADMGSYSVSIAVPGPGSPPAVHIDSPAPGDLISSSLTISGWAIDNATAIGNVQIQIDGMAVGTAIYGTSRPDVCTAFPGRPGCPNVGFTFQMSTASLSSGTHTVTAVATDTDAIPDSAFYMVTFRK